MQLNKSESNPMLVGCMELIGDERKKMQEDQKRLNDQMKETPEIMELLEQNKKEMAALQALHQQKLNQAMRDNTVIAGLMDELNEDRKSLQERQQMFEQEMFKATYMTPVMITPEPVKDEEGNFKLVADSKIAIQVLPLKNQKGVMMAFTDRKEFEKWSNSEGTCTVSLKMYDFFGAVLRDEKIAGVAINPFGANVLVPRERIEAMVKAAADQKQRSAAKAKNVEIVEADINE